MQRLLALMAAGLFVATMAGTAAACDGLGKVAQDETGPITTALDTQPITPKPTTTQSGTKSGG